MMLLTVLVSLLLTGVKSDCVWYDQCGDDPEFGDGLHGLNCVYNGPAVKSEDPEMIVLLKQACPHLLTEHGNQGTESTSIELCCAKQQVQKFIEQNELPTLVLGRCPTCLFNFKRIFCDMMCHPNQALFLNASKIIKKADSNEDMVKVLDYHVSEEYAEKVYKSCADVVNPSTSGSVMDLLCGPWGGALCSPQRLLDYLGSISNGYAPFQINYFLHNKENKTEFEPHNPPVIPCNQEALPGSGSCSCTDCELSCAAPDFSPYIKQEFAKANQVDIWQLSILIIFISGMMIGLISFIFHQYFNVKNNVVFVEECQKQEQHDESQQNQQESGPEIVQKQSFGAKIDLFMTGAFTKIATFAAQSPIKTLLIMITLALALCIGITQLRYNKKT